MRRALLALIVCISTAAPAAAYGPSGKLHYTQVEMSFFRLILGCQKVNVWDRAGCFAFIETLRHTRRGDAPPQQFLKLLETGRTLFGQ